MASTDLDAAGRGDARAIVILTSLAVVVALVLLTRSLGVALAVALATAAAFAAATGLTVVVFQHVLASPPCPSGCLSW
jgi:uncharacterized membrane protein YdfJ with MMPL/SSD domain